jgi:hypothetical protein
MPKYVIAYHGGKKFESQQEGRAAQMKWKSRRSARCRMSKIGDIAGSFADLPFTGIWSRRLWWSRRRLGQPLFRYHRHGGGMRSDHPTRQGALRYRT